MQALPATPFTHLSASAWAYLLMRAIKHLSSYSWLLIIFFPSWVSAHDSEFRGSYTWGAEVDVFSPCGSSLVYWTSYNWAGSGLREFYRANTSKPYQPIYVSFRGQVLDEAVDGFASRYDGLIRISEIHIMEKDIPSDCDTNS